MALYITLNDNTTIEHNIHNALIPESIASNIKYIHIDNDELIEARKYIWHIDNILNVFVLYGDMAKTLIYNMFVVDKTA